MLKIKTKVRKIGSSYGVLIPKALVDCDALPLGKEIVLKVMTFSELKKLSEKKDKPLHNAVVVQGSPLELVLTVPEKDYKKVGGVRV